GEKGPGRDQWERHDAKEDRFYVIRNIFSFPTSTTSLTRKKSTSHNRHSLEVKATTPILTLLHRGRR
ncbi:hypothetical protein L195_g061852, partial [Trifolium pratense]